MTWQRRHCIECWHDMEHCQTCGCHETMPSTFIENAQTSARMDGSGEERPRSAGTLGARATTEPTSERNAVTASNDTRQPVSDG